MSVLRVPEEKGTISSVADLLQIVNNWSSRYWDNDRGYPLTWYRGQTQDWELLPSVLRETFYNALSDRRFRHVTLSNEEEILRFEYNINYQFLFRAAPYFSRDLSLVERYFLAQHHGLPTRLLDWTVFPLTALFFAVIDHDDHDGFVNVINPRHFFPNTAENINNSDEVVNQSHRYVSDFVELVNNTELKSDVSGYKQVRQELKFVLPICPDHTLGRMMQQGARFALFLPDTDRYYFLKHVEKYRIPHEKKECIRNELLHLNVSESTIFCDLDSLAKEIKRVYKLF